MLLQIAQNGRPTFVLFWYFLSQPFWCSFEKHLNTGYNFRRSFGIKTFPKSWNLGIFLGSSSAILHLHCGFVVA